MEPADCAGKYHLGSARAGSRVLRLGFRQRPACLSCAGCVALSLKSCSELESFLLHPPSKLLGTSVSRGSLHLSRFCLPRSFLSQKSQWPDSQQTQSMDARWPAWCCVLAFSLTLPNYAMWTDGPEFGRGQPPEPGPLGSAHPGATAGRTFVLSPLQNSLLVSGGTPFAHLGHPPPLKLSCSGREPGTPCAMWQSPCSEPERASLLRGFRGLPRWS